MNAQPLLDDLDTISAQARLLVPINGRNAADGVVHPLGEVTAGDLEASPLQLQLLLETPSRETNRDHLASMFAFDIEQPRPPIPPSPTPPPQKPRKHATAAERKQLWQERQAAAKERSLMGRSTRAVKAMSRAFAEEAGMQPSSDAELAGPSSGILPSPRFSTRSRRKIRDATPSSIVKEGPESTIRLQSKPQRGVARLEVVASISDKQRRRSERAMDIVAGHIDSQDQFKRFNVGWVLPEGSKRRRSERPPEPSPSISRECLEGHIAVV